MRQLSTNILIIITVILFSLTGCATKRPVLYPNAYLKNVGKASAEHDINECIELAEASGVDAYNESDIAINTAGGAALGGALGAATGAIHGHAGSGAATGAAAGGIGGLAHGLFSSNEPDPIFRSFVNKCLRDAGYDPIGWS